MKNVLITFALFLFGQILLWLVSINDNIAATEEVTIETIMISLFMGLYYAGHRWARWIAAVLLGSLALILAIMTFEGFGFGFLAVAFAYAAVVVILFNHKGRTEPLQNAEIDSNASDLKEPIAPPKPPVADGFYVGDEVYRYPLLLTRYQSLFIDAILFLTIMVVTMVMMGDSESRQMVMISLAVIFSFVYEPLLTTYSATLGQRLMGIRVRDVKNPKERINVFQAYARFLVKWFLGWLSFVTINFNPQHRAIHDWAGSSVVIRIR
jgi:uncharacterized RDD family membrane protein YckC